MDDIRIYVACHRESLTPRCPLFRPIQAGAGVNGRLPGLLHDDEGDNISEKNPRWCELTALYWVWKHEDADVIGFCHYRRYFDFSENPPEPDAYGTQRCEALTAAAEERLGMDEASIRRAIAGKSLLVANPTPLRTLGAADLFEQYAAAPELRREDLLCAIGVLEEKYPEYREAAARYLHGDRFYPCNLFVMEKSLFRVYCAWLFDVLEETERRLDWTDRSVESLRTMGHIAERLLGVFYTRQQQLGRAVGVLPWSLMRCTEPFVPPEPAFPGEGVPIVLCFNAYFAPYAAAALRSLAAHFSPERRYDLLVLHTDIGPVDRKLMALSLGERENISLRFVNLLPLVADLCWKAHGHITVETYFRLQIPWLLKSYDKALYLDCDLLALRDVAELYDTPLDGLLLAAAADPDHAGQYGGVLPAQKAYTDGVLQLEKPYDYFQAGVLLLNLAEFRRSFGENELTELAQAREYMYMDQDLLNACCQGRVKLISQRWNLLMDFGGIRMNEVIRRGAPKRIYDEYRQARRDPWIVHYAGCDKPWDEPGCDYGALFWAYARETPYYELMLRRMACRAEPPPKPLL
ncbi:MAG: DUF4422 domain-containing protein, partial [Oscillospiraceae bacterium]|nr:DUF4422 domain-containing protein [Oscillospiraceae bacterium]